MKNVWKKASSIIIFIAAAVLVIGFLIKMGVFEDEEEQVAIVSGEVVRVSEGNILFGSGGQYWVHTQGVPVLDEDGNRADARKIQVGQSILVKFTGGMNESYPATFSGVAEIVVKSGETSGQVESENTTEDSQENERTEPAQEYLENKEEAEDYLRELNGDEQPLGLVADVIMTSELTEDNIVEITLTNTGTFVVTDWIVIYESSYDIVTIDAAELSMNERLVKKFKALDENGTLEPGDSVTIHLEIDGTYHDIEKYRVYGRGDGANTSVLDMITYHADTKETTLTIYDIEENDIQGPITTEGLDVNPE